MKQLITILLCLFTLFAEAQVNTNDTNKYFKSYDYGFSYKRLQAREAFIMPTDTVINKLGAVSLNGAIYLGNGIKWTSIGGGTTIDTTNQFVKRLTRTPGKDSIIYFVGANRFAIKDSVGGSTTDTTSLSNRINQRIDSLRRSNDSVYAYRNGTRFFQFKDSVGSGGGNFWKTSGTTILGGADTIVSDNGTLIFIGGSEDMARFSVQANNIDISTSGGDLKIIGLDALNDTTNYKPLIINLSTGAIEQSTSWVGGGGGGVAVDTIFRTLGKDSIFYKKNNITYAIKDSVGTNPAPVGYYGAFQDTTTQTAASINTAYPVNLGVTDLSNGITIANNSKIKIANAGIYNIQFSLQLEKSGGSGNMIADIWLRKNGVNIPSTTGKVVLTGSANASPVVAAWNYVIAVSSNDSLELMWATSNDNVVIKASPATSPHPSIPSAILTVTQQSGIMAGTGISPLDTANMLSNYAKTNLVNTKLNISDTASMLSSYSTRINDKLTIADTSALQRKSIPAYSIMANNTNATANVTAQNFKQFGNQTYSDSITFTGATTPSGATNHSFRWSQIGNLVTLHITLTYATIGSLSQVAIEIPDGLPAPILPTGLTANNEIIAYGSGFMVTNTTGVAGVFSKVFLRQNTGLVNDYEVVINQASNASYRIFNATIQYFAK